MRAVSTTSNERIKELPRPIRSLFEQYNEYLLLEKGSSKNTLAAYENDLLRYLEFLARRDVTVLKDVTPEHAREHVAVLSELGMSAASIARALSAIRGLHKFALV